MRRDIRIASPCPADWNGMTGDDRVRHCTECNLNVYNFSAMTSVEVEQLVATREGRLCARLYQRRDGTILTKDCPVGVEVKIRRISRVAGIAMAAASAGMNFAMAQTTSAQEPSQLVQIQKEETGIKIEVANWRGTGVAQAKVSFKDSTGKKYSGVTDADGTFTVFGIQPGNYKVKIRMPDSPTVQKKVTVVSDQMVVIQLTTPSVVVVGQVE